MAKKHYARLVIPGTISNGKILRTLDRARVSDIASHFRIFAAKQGMADTQFKANRVAVYYPQSLGVESVGKIMAALLELNWIIKHSTLYFEHKKGMRELEMRFYKEDS